MTNEQEERLVVAFEHISKALWELANCVDENGIFHLEHHMFSGSGVEHPFYVEKV